MNLHVREACPDAGGVAGEERKPLDEHTNAVACQTCHIPSFSREQPIEVFWDWSTAGEKDADGNEISPVDASLGVPTYAGKKGSFVWEQDVEPILGWWNGTEVNRILPGDTYPEDQSPIDIASRVGSVDDPEARIYPFKVMGGIQGVDPATNQVLVPHLFGKVGGPTPYWAAWDWDAAFSDGMAYAELGYSGDPMSVGGRQRQGERRDPGR